MFWFVSISKNFPGTPSHIRVLPFGRRWAPEKTSEKNHEISEDDLKRFLDNIQEVTNEYIEKLNSLQKSKEKEILF